jgi:predicted O-methyltransferase YrrM
MDYPLVDAQLASGERCFDAELAKSYAASCLEHPYWPTMKPIERKSMLGPQSLMLLRAFAIESKGAVYEIGPYVGGSTIAILSGISVGSPRKVVSTDKGGAYDHHELPSEDIHADWARNLAEAGFAGQAHLIKGHANVPATGEELERVLDGDRIGLLFIDANGAVWKNMEYIVHLLMDDCLFVVDDYTKLDVPEDEHLNEKFEISRASVDEAVALGVIEFYTAQMWGTWFGRIKPELKDAFPGLLAREKERFG